MDTIQHAVPPEQGIATYGNISTAHPAFPRDRLRIIKELGHGAFGLVLLAEAVGITDRKVTQVAVKTVKGRQRLSDSLDC